MSGLSAIAGLGSIFGVISKLIDLVGMFIPQVKEWNQNRLKKADEEKIKQAFLNAEKEKAAKEINDNFRNP